MQIERTLLGLFGAGSFGREVMPFSRVLQGMEVVFVDDGPDVDKLSGQPVHSERQFWQAGARHERFNVTEADTFLRRKISENALSRGAVPHQLQAQTATLLDGHLVAEGAMLCNNSIVGTNTKIGRYFHLYVNAYLAHDCVVGDCVTFSPSVRCCGHVNIGDLVFVGAGAVIRDGTASRPLTIGEGAAIGMGAVVANDVPPYTTVVGSLARPVAKE